MTDPENPFKEGYLWVPPKASLFVSKPWQKKFCRLYRSSKQGIERLEIFENEDDVKNSTIPIITLENCVKISEDVQKNQSNVFAVITKLTTHHFSANSHHDMLEWIVAFQSVAFRDNASRQTIEEDNDLYYSSGDTGVFSVNLVSSEASERCGLSCGNYILIVTPGALQLRDPEENTILVTWPYRFIRRYGYKSGKFIFEAGRKCTTGAGFFNFEHSNQQEIFRCISSKMRDMKKFLSGEGIIFGDKQLQAALNMVPGSRSPLPPSPTGSTPAILDSEMNSMGSVKHFTPYSSTDVSPTTERLFVPTERHLSLFERHSSVERYSYRTEKSASTERMLARERSVSNDRSLSSERTLSIPIERILPLSPPPPTERPPPPPPKPNKPEKPPRKNLPPLKLDVLPRLNKDAYDDVEIRNDAWKTFGVLSTPHSERERPLIPPKTSSEMVRTPETQKIFLANTTSFHDNDYDRLQHLGTTSKITSPGYRQVGPSLTSSRGTRSGNSSGDELDESMDESLLHKQVSELEYSLVCKPNRV